MTVRPPPAGNTDFKRWAERLNDYLAKSQSKLAYYLAGQSAHDDGVLLWDRDNSQVIVSSNGSWVPLTGGGGGGSITNYLRDDADDSTNFRLTMGGLTVDTDTLYVDDTNNEVGIGTTTPSEKLEVVGNVEATEFIGDLRGAVVFKAQAGEALTKGDVVYISGISGQTTVVSKARASTATKMPAFGLAAKNASVNAALEVCTFGTLDGLNTSSFTEGDELFVQAGVSGSLTSTAPSGESAQIQKIGKVTRSHATSGSIKIMGAGRSNATPNLNDGNIFIGDANDQTTTVSLSSKVSALETSHSDVVQDGDFTSEGLMKRGATAGAYSIVTDNSSNWNAAYAWGDHASAGYLTSETSHGDVVVDGDFASEGLMKRGASNGTYSIVTDNSSNWDTAYGWGDHGSAGYLTSIADGSITTAKLGNQAVTGAKISANTIGSGNMANDSIFTAAIADGQVTAAKLADTYLTSIAAGSVGTSELATSAVIPSKLQTGAVTSDKIANGAVTNTKIASGAVSNSQLAGSISGNKILTSTSIELENATTSPFVSGSTTYSGASILYKVEKSNYSGTMYDHGGIGTTQRAYGDSRYTYMSQGNIAVGVFGIFGGTGTGHSYFQPLTTSGGNHQGKMYLGTSNAKWNTVYASTSSINTSDRTTKQQIEVISDAEARVATAAKALMRKFKFNDSVEEKGEDARIHFGIIAQDLQDAFSAEGLDASKYAMFCSDTWWEHEGKTYNFQEDAPEDAVEITQLGVRYSELLAFIIATL